MSFQKLRSSQIKLDSITNDHIKVGTLIDETKLNIDWATRGDEILGKKLLVDYVQVDGKAISSGVSSVAVSAQISAPAASTSADKGAVVEDGKNKVILRDANTGDPIVSVDGTEVYGQLTHDGSDYLLSFFYKDNSGLEQTHTFVDAGTIDFQFPQRFDFLNIAENYAANEKFVDGASDVSARLDLEQIVADAFGSSYSLDHDGDANRGKTLVQEILDETSGVTNTGVRAKTIIDEIVNARNGKVNVGTRIGDVEGRVSTNETDIGNLQTEITNARGEETTLDARLDGIETSINSASSEDEIRTKELESVGVVNGVGVTAQATPDMTVNVAGGVVYNAEGERFAPSANSSLSVSPADSTNPRIDLVTVDALGAIGLVQGTTAVAPTAPAIPAGHVVLAEVTVPAAATAITGAEISDKRTYVGTGKEIQDARHSELQSKDFSNVDARIDSDVAFLDNKVDTEIQDRKDADQAIVDALSSNANGEGASTVGIEDVAGVFTSVTVEGALKELDDKVISEANTREQADTDLSDRIDGLEGDKHGHFYEDKQVLSGDALIGTSGYTLTGGTFVAGNKSLQVFVNGMLQMAGVHYTEVTNVDGEGTGVDFAPELIAEGDVLQFRWEK